MATRTKPKPDDPYWHRLIRIGFPQYADALRQLNALDGLSPADATNVADQVHTLAVKYKMLGDGLTDTRLAEQLHNKSVNVPAGADATAWDDPVAVGRAFTIAKGALTC